MSENDKWESLEELNSIAKALDEKQTEYINKSKELRDQMTQLVIDAEKKGFLVKEYVPILVFYKVEGYNPNIII